MRRYVFLVLRFSLRFNEDNGMADWDVFCWTAETAAEGQELDQLPPCTIISQDLGAETEKRELGMNCIV